jgi:hypothetical protein
MSLSFSRVSPVLILLLLRVSSWQTSLCCSVPYWDGHRVERPATSNPLFFDLISRFFLPFFATSFARQTDIQEGLHSHNHFMFS